MSVDPMADKYPGISGYAYCLNNPMNLTDPDGRDPIRRAARYARKNNINGEFKSGQNGGAILQWAEGGYSGTTVHSLQFKPNLAEKVGALAGSIGRAIGNFFTPKSGVRMTSENGVGSSPTKTEHFDGTVDVTNFPTPGGGANGWAKGWKGLLYGINDAANAVDLVDKLTPEKELEYKGNGEIFFESQNKMTGGKGQGSTKYRGSEDSIKTVEMIKKSGNKIKEIIKTYE